MSDTPSVSDLAADLGRIRTIVLVRWLGVAFGLGQILGYGTMAYPAGLREAALTIVAALAVGNLVFEVVRRRTTTRISMRRLGLAMLALDVVALSGLTWVYAFDSLSAIFAILVLLPIEAAVLFGLPGAMWTWGAVAVLYVGREWFGTRYGNPFEIESVTFRIGLIGIVALIVGLLVRDLVAQRAATTAALAEARRSEAARSRLVSMLAHDVRAPIAAARSAFDTLRVGGDRLDGERREAITTAGRRQADRALLIARDLLDLARAEAGTLTIETEPVVVAELTARLEEVLEGRVALAVDVGDQVVVADPSRLEQVLYNLVDNAIKHGAPPVELAARTEDDTVVLTVRDHGPGVPPDVQLFEQFSHAGEGSVGLGMWIVRALVQAHGGTVTYEHADPGARFVVRLPAGGASAQALGTASRSTRGTTAPVSRS